MKMDPTEITWYEDGSFLEYHEDETIESRKIIECTLEQAIQFAWENKFYLYIQPELQDSGLDVDYTE